MTLRQANAFVVEHHRHAGAVVGCRCSIGAVHAGRLVGVAILGRPIARALDEGLTAEVTRLCSDGTPNACSFLYGAVYRAALAIGYSRVVTYTLESERGSSLRAAGWRPVARVAWEPWDREAASPVPAGPRKVRWEKGSRGGASLLEVVGALRRKAAV